MSGTDSVESPGSTKKTTASGSAMSSISSGDTAATSTVHYGDRSTSVVWGRAIFVAIMLTVSGVLGYLSYYFLAESETHLAEEQYYSVTARALEATRTLTTNKLVHGSMVMAKLASHSFPNASSWPFIWVDGYLDIVQSVIPTSAYTGMHLLPIVPPEQLSDWEDFAYANFRDFFGENTTTGAQSHFGEGVWVQDSSVDTVDNRFHDTTGVSLHGSPYDLIAPKYQHGLGDKSPYVMMNVHGFRIQAQSLDAVINCTKFERPDDPTKSCQGLSAMHPPLIKNGLFDPNGVFSFFSTPIFPQNDPDTLVGFIFVAIWWVEVMEEVFPADVDGIDCVMTASFEDTESVYSFTVQDGSGVFLGKGDHHDPSWDDYKMEQLLMDPEGMSKDSGVYTLACYPNESFKSNYETKNPTIAAIGAVLITLLTSLFFFGYDRCVTNEVDAKKELLEAKRQFVRFVSHEVRTPLNSVCMGLTLMKEEMVQALGNKNVDEMQKKAAENEPEDIATSTFNLANEVLANAQCSVDVLNDLLNYDKIESGTLSLELTVIPIWKLIERTVKEFTLPMASKNIKLHFELPSGSPMEGDDLQLKYQMVIGDDVRIMQVIRNLVSNAIKFTPEGRDIYIEAKWQRSNLKNKECTFDVRKPRDKVTCRSSGDLILTVKDTGAGMTKEQLKKLFGKGVQFNVNELQHGNGSGLGLYIAMGIVEQHDGSLVCDSEGLEQGTTFTVTIPLYNLPSDSTEVGHSMNTMKDAELYEESKLRILVVDDAVSNRKLLSRLLTNRGHVTEQAEDGLVAVNMVKKAGESGTLFDLILLDYEMPNMDGPEAAREIRNQGSDVFIAGVTGNLLPEDVQYFRSCGANTILPKPFRITDLENLIFEHNIFSSSAVESETGKPAGSDSDV